MMLLSPAALARTLYLNSKVSGMFKSSHDLALIEKIVLNSVPLVGVTSKTPGDGGALASNVISFPAGPISYAIRVME